MGCSFNSQTTTSLVVLVHMELHFVQRTVDGTNGVLGMAGLERCCELGTGSVKSFELREASPNSFDC